MTTVTNRTAALSAADSGPASRATLSEVAERAGVSISTVSKVLNGRGGVSLDTRARVTGILRDQRYNRRNSTQAAAPLLELVCQALDSPWMVEVVVGVESVARENGLSVVVTGMKDRGAGDASWIEGVLQRRPLGVVLVIADLSDDNRHQLRSHSIPFVIIDPEGDPDPDVPAIGSANWMGGFMATRHLIGLGHRDIATISGPDGFMASTARLSGYRAALAGAGIPEHGGYVRGGDFSLEVGLAEGLVLLGRPDRPTAIFAASDMQALGVYEAARTLALRIPDDLSVVGFDDLHMTRFTGPPMTTVRQPLTEMAEEATRLVLRLREEPALRSTRLELATTLVVRGSTAHPAPSG
ncbi:LacI family transcriptional regulator [Frondihabitans sp. PhB188]|uniref:LacI family DNA-binding transcriptional regulator n=1 Tax=Frondihabitans sp. PhB188 TaxID=2485200 RepID=UPI000F47348E|nr:substrate-binding domain-containing protein [Frondihabitans sp. PhB188]ROQ36770.1 LacI family transcriptional regulator [Frondihabitans sp. PhB188]